MSGGLSKVLTATQWHAVEDRENGDLGGANPLGRDSGGSCNLVQEISFHIVKFSQFLVL